MKKQTNNKQIIVDTETLGSMPFCRDNTAKARYLAKIEPDYHDYTELCICVDGNFALQFGEKIVDIEEGDFGIIFPDVLHTELMRQGFSYNAIWMAFDDIRITLHLSGRNEEEDFVVTDWFTMKSDYECLHLLKNMRAESMNRSLHHPELINAYMMHLLIATLRKIQLLNANNPEKMPWKETIAAEIHDYIEKNYSKHIKLEEIAQKLCLSITYLNTVFKSISGKSIMQYSNDFRIEKAKRLLESSEYSMEDIAALLGYYDQYHFCKTFKNKTGYTPSNYKKLIPAAME